ncbi:hypothetical protein WJX73_003041 [Symbiochloris irregularis]|uniref:Small ubiquitin-related modifier n=1 Tax=Symbiochloris irregularis TaxID=706552 RepID=A0AAW1PH50_9CHLO
MAEDSGETKPKVEQAFQIVVKDQTGGEVHFKVKPTTKFGKIMASYAANKSVDQKSIKFIFDGSRLHENQTPEGVGMESDDCIDAMIEQMGGGKW